MRRWSFTLRIRPGGVSGFRVHLLSSPAGDEVGTLELPCAADGIGPLVEELEQSVLPRSRHLRPDAAGTGEADGPGLDGGLEALGEALFRSLFPAPVRRRWDECVEEVVERPERPEGPGRGLRLVLRSDPTCRSTATLHQLPWELLRDPATGSFLALSRKTTILRQLALDDAAVLEEPEPARTLRILAVLSCPADLAPLDLARERRRIEEAVEGRTEIRLRVLESPTFAELTEVVRGEPFHVLHFMGHGAVDRGPRQGDPERAHLFLDGPDGGAVRLPAERLAQVVRDVDSLRLIFLNACETGRSPAGADRPFAALSHALLRSGVPAVLAMRLPIPDRPAIELARVFYRELAAGAPVDEALAEARVALYAAESGAPSGAGRSRGAWAVPALFVRRPELAIFRPRSADGARTRRADRSRRRWLSAAALLVLGALIVALFFVRAPWAGVELRVAADRVAFTLTEDRSLVDTLDLVELAVPDLAVLRHPDPLTGIPRTVTPEWTGAERLGFLVRLLEPVSGGLSLDGAVLPTGTRVELVHAAPRALRLSLELPAGDRRLTASVGPGAVLRLVPGPPEPFDLGSGGRLVVFPRDDRIDLDLTLAEAGPGPEAFHTPLAVTDLRFVEIREERSDGASRVRAVSTLESGEVALEPLGGGEPAAVALERHQTLAFDGLSGRITGLELGEESLLVELRGRAQAVALREPDGRRVDLMPTWSATPWALRLGAASGALALLMGIVAHLGTLLRWTAGDVPLRRTLHPMTRSEP